MWLIAQLLDQWQQRLGRLQELAQEPADGSTWLWRVRTRILAFLVSRYSDPVAAASQETGVDGASYEPHSPVETFCAVEPEEAPPRARASLAEQLQAIRSSNQEARQRWKPGRSLGLRPFVLTGKS